MVAGQPPSSGLLQRRHLAVSAGHQLLLPPVAGTGQQVSMDSVGSVPLVVLAGALGTLAAVFLRVTGRWPGGRPALGPFQSGVLAISLVGVSLVYAAVFGAKPGR